MDGFVNFITHQCGVNPNDSILVGVSGGIDSVSLLDLLVRYGFNPVIAHCNFSLRGQESDGDEEFVTELSHKYNIPFEKIRFNTTEYARERQISIEMAARDLRYEWFRKVAIRRQCQWIAVAHHRDDNIETFFLNLIRGAGINGLSGMKPVSGSLIRPLLFASREAIVSYAKQNSLKYRNDSSNDDTVFLRNKIRHEILPSLEKINPSLRSHLVQTIQNLGDVNEILQERVEFFIHSVVKEENKNIFLSTVQLKQFIGWHSLLFEFLRRYSFSSPVIKDIIHTLDGPSGAYFLSPTHTLVRDRQQLILSIREGNDDMEYPIAEGQNEFSDPLQLRINQFSADGYLISRDCHVACFDYETIEFPLVLRRWREGDVFHPFGMKGIKKVSDYFIDQKFSLKAKKDTWLLCSGDHIIWIVGHRTDDRHRICSKTRKVLQIELIRA